DPVGDLLRARHLGALELALDRRLHTGDGGAVARADERDVDRAGEPGELLELRQREVDVRRLAAERRLYEPDDAERRAVQIEVRADLQRVGLRVRGRDERLVAAGAAQVAAARDLAGRDEREGRSPLV